MPVTVDLSSAQQSVVDHRGADLQVIACAGAGKTEFISRRVAALIGEGAQPVSIVAFTFTERAAAELKERITRRVAERMGPGFRDRLGPMFVGTIHAYCFRLLQDYVPRYGNYDVLDENRHAGFLSRVHRSIGLSKLKAKHWAPIRDFMRTVDVIGNECIPASALAGTPLGECYDAYRAALHRYHFLTFGLLITSALEALERPEVFPRVHGPLRHLLVDEYQDINPAQERLIELLSRAPVQLTVVGDDDQLGKQILAHAGAAAPGTGTVLPFRSVEPKASERFETCVPLTSLRAPAGRFSEEQASLDEVAGWAAEWVTWDNHPNFEPGMFVARVQGKSMEPEILDGAYCLFRPARAGSRQGKRLLVWPSGIEDPMTSGHYTLKMYTSEKAKTEDGWEHTTIVLKPLNPDFAPIVLTPKDEGDVRVVVELVQVLH